MWGVGIVFISFSGYICIAHQNLIPMKFNKTLFKFSLSDVFRFFIFMSVIVVAVMYLMSLLFGFSFSSYFLSSKIITPLVAFLPMFFVLLYNKNGQLVISDFKDLSKVKKEIENKLMKIGFVVSEQTDGMIKYDRKTKLGRAISGVFKEYIIVNYDNQSVSVNSNRGILMRLQMHLSKMD